MTQSKDHYNGSVYPALVSNVDPSRRSVTRAGTSGATSVEDTLRDILGWRPKTDDPRGFVAALSASFNLKEVAGRVEFDYLPRSYAVQMQADLGAVTGAQASLYTRARNSLDHALRLLNGLTPLRSDYDVQDTDATREIVTTLLTDLVAELGVVGGPRVQRVEDLLRQLFGVDLDVKDINPDTVKGQFKMLRERFGFDRDRIGRLEEEVNLTNYWTVVEYANDIRRGWRDNRKYFARGQQTNGEAFFGTQLVQLSRQLALVADTVEETYFVLDSVFIDDTQRQITWLEFKGNLGPRLSVHELLDWVSRVATSEGPRLIQNAGRDGLDSLCCTLDKLAELVKCTYTPRLANWKQLPSAFKEERVQRVIKELSRQIRDAHALAFPLVREVVDDRPAPIPPSPVLIAIEAEQQHDGTWCVTATGMHFGQQAELHIVYDSADMKVQTIRMGKDAGRQDFIEANLPTHFHLLRRVKNLEGYVCAEAGEKSATVPVAWK